MADEEIRVEIIIEDEEAIRGADELRDRVDDLKKRLLELSIAGKQSLDDIAKSMRDVAKIKVEGKFETDEEAQKAQSEATKEFKDNLKTALTEAKREQKEFFDEQVRLSTQASKTRQQQAKAAAAAEKAELVKLRNAHREYVKVSQQGFGVMSSAARQYGQTIQRIRNIITQTAQRTGQSWQQVAQRMQQLGVPTMQINQALKQLNTASTQAQGGLQGLIQRLGNLGNVGQFVFGSVLGFTAVTVLHRVTRAFVDFAKEILQRGTEMTEVIFTLEVAIRGLQRIGLDTTIEGWTERIQDLKKEFPFFPKREFIEGASLAALMTREFGFTEQQIANIVRQASILAQITGKDLLESVRGITFAIGSGYFESLQRAGVNISRAVVANEALAQGYEGVYNELEPTIRASVTYSVIQNNLNAIQDDASRKVETFAGQVQILTSRLEDLQNLFGEVVTSSDSLIETLEVFSNLLGAISDVYETLSRANIDIFAPVKELLGIETLIKNIEILTTTLEGLANVIDGLITSAQALGTILGALGSIAGAFGLESVQQVLDSISESIFNVTKSLGDLEQTEIEAPKMMIGELEFSQDEYNEVIKATEELVKEINKIDEEAAEKNAEIWEDWRNDRLEIWEGHLERLADLESDLANRLADIDIKAQRRVEDEIANNAFRTSETIRQFNIRREDAERKFREREIKEERRFQEKMRQLRENFLLNLEDAVRERDARQIIRLTRQFNLRRDQMIREEKLNKTDREDQFKAELAQIERQKQERLRQLAIEHQRRLDDIARQAERERAQAQVDFERRKADETARAIEEQQERRKRRDQQLADMEDWRQERINAVITGLIEEHDLTSKQLDAIGFLWEGTFGKDGSIERALEYGEKRALQHLIWMNMLTARIEALRLRIANIPPGGPLTPVTEFDNAGGQAEGGTIIARKPTVAIFGEAGPEMATFTPLNKLGSQGSKVTPMSATNMPMDGRIRLEMLLSPDLEARVVDNTLGEIADINFAIERARK
jgi:hypothetical protein